MHDLGQIGRTTWHDGGEEKYSFQHSVSVSRSSPFLAKHVPLSSNFRDILEFQERWEWWYEVWLATGYRPRLHEMCIMKRPEHCLCRMQADAYARVHHKKLHVIIRIKQLSITE
ncbi:predicted protein [Histoplasma capsulatum H143]|uniref:Uncharacterized protein n=1 Tax=Ajellomyces capsulatus (strain H143) TaxID=544712 RepID=C6HR00_AJECH|nr:predicted protein [Histoplasma capsulatum H143]